MRCEPRLSKWCDSVELRAKRSKWREPTELGAESFANFDLATRTNAGRIGEVGLDLIPFDNDVLSLEMGGCFRDLYLEQDTTSLYYVAKSLMRMQVGADACETFLVLAFSWVLLCAMLLDSIATGFLIQLPS